jgi:hypothetical protein
LTATLSRVRRGYLTAALGALLLAVAPAGSAALHTAQPVVFTGYAFDACTAPSTNALQAWSASPYRAVGIYLGGVNRACRDGNLSASWVGSTLGMGWSLLPLYVGLQAPCVSQSSLAKISTNATTAATQGRAAADDAASLALGFGLPSGSPIYLDVEGYGTNDTTCTRAVQAFVAGWVEELHAESLAAGVYGSAASTIRDVSRLATLPDDAWIANWNGVQTVFGDPYVSDTLWANHQRLHQYKGGHNETWGGVTINIDSNVVDALAVGGGPVAPPPPAPPAGSVASGDGKATATWPDGAFQSTAVVTLTPTSQPPSPNGYAVQLTVTDSITLAPVAGFAQPVTIHLAVPANGLAPSFSTDGTTWTPLPRSQYTLLGDGTVNITTLVPGYFGLLADTVPPTQPVARGLFGKGALRLSWSASTDNAGSIARYEILLDGVPSARVAGTVRRVTVRAFHPAAQTVYRVRAVDTAGNAGKPSPPVVVVPTARPNDTPTPLPRWAWPLYAWQHVRGGPRPATAPRKPPVWYWHWAAWRAAPFHVRR